MTTSSRAIASLTALMASLAFSLLTGVTAATAAPLPAFPPVAFLAPQLTVTVDHALIEPSGAQGYNVIARYPTGTALVGSITLTRDLHNGAPAQVVFTTSSLGVFTGSGAGDPIFFAPIGDETLTAVFTPSTSGAPGATSSASFQVRIAGATAAVQVGSAVAGAATPVTTTITVPSTGAGQPIDGRVSLQIDALGEQASCSPTALTATTARCSTTLPASLAAGTHSLTASWTTSPSFQSASTSTPVVIVAAKKSGGAATPSHTATATAPTPSASATATALAGGSDSNSAPSTADASSSAAGIPLWLGIALGILLVTILGVATFVTIGIVRARRAAQAA